MFLKRNAATMNKHERTTMIDNGLAERLDQRLATAGIIGLGYVGLPLAAACARAGFSTVGFDVDSEKIAALNGGRSYIDAVSSEDLARHVDGKKFRATDDFSQLSDCDVIVICVPTPLTRHREPDLKYVTNTAETIAKYLRKGQLVALESTTFPGTTEEVVKPILEKSGLKSGSDFFLGFSPEREDPGNTSFRTVTIPKVVAGEGPVASMLMQSFYGAVVEKVVAVSAPGVAEAVKITENVFRAVNIALVNELKVIYDAMGIDVWEVIDAAATKPFGYMPFYPGPGLGGHCIPIDPFYLTWKSREYGLSTRFIELAGEINISMPKYVVAKVEEALDRVQQVSLSSSRILVIGLAYKKNVSDIRESPSFELMELLEKRGAKVEYHDPHAPVIPMTREHAGFAGRKSMALSAEGIGGYHAVIVATDHDVVDYELIAANARLVVDTRNVFARKGVTTERVVKA
jgi:UDP-N-acetyl-D-glucosamine dehydrogenase